MDQSDFLMECQKSLQKVTVFRKSRCKKSRFSEKVVAKNTAFIYCDVMKNWPMKRKIYEQLLAWKKSISKSPLMIKGARQVGKTFILRQFGEKEFSSCHIFNFEKDRKLFSIFEKDFLPYRIIDELSIYSGKKIDIENDLTIFDEIQECPKALTSLKYFCEDMPGMPLCCAGSLIGVKMSNESFPVGKVDFLEMYPINFEEFLCAINDEMSLEIFHSLIISTWQSEISHHQLWNFLKEYYVVGGMPKAVLSYISLRGDNRLEAMQEE